MKKLIFLFSLLFLAFASFSIVSAVGQGERIRSFDSNVVVRKDNSAQVTETIVYDFGGNSRHGIYRDIPIDYQDGAKNYYLSADYQETVDEKGELVQSEEVEESGNLRIRLGDPDTKITGVHTYKISYILRPIILKKDKQPFLNLDVVGTGWQVPIDSASVKLSAEGGAELTNLVCFYGPQGAKNSCPQEGTASFTVQNLAPGSGMTINANLPKGFVSTYLTPNKQRPLDWAKIISEAFIPLVIVAGLGSSGLVIALRRLAARKKRKSQIVVAQYEPPASLTPAEIGHLEDDSSDMAEITATLIDLAVRGYLKIIQTEKKGLGKIFGGSMNFTLESLRNSEGLSRDEAILLDALFSKGSPVEINKLDKKAMATAVHSFKSNTKKSLQEKGFYEKSGGLLKKGSLSDEGAKEWALVDGFKLYLTVVEKDRLKFSDAPEKTPERFNKLLPYAVALGVEKEWAKQFEGIDISSSTSGWYSGSNISLLTAAALTSSLSSGFASAISSNSSVSSSGGSSGSGFGGGGGGSW